MKRRNFIYLSTSAGLAFSLPHYSFGSKAKTSAIRLSDYEKLVDGLLNEWCNGMISVQVNNPQDLAVHGALYCPACDKIHGRCMDAVYPFLHMAAKTGHEKYLHAAIDVMKWSENVSMPDGSWTVIPDPKSWKGISVFGAIALGEALHHHGDILPKEVKVQWTDRLRKAADFIHRNFTIDYSHVNYAFTAVYALNFLGRMFDNPAYIAHSKSLAAELPNWLTTPNKLIFGENNPADKASPKGLMPVDLGYNVEETLNGLVQYATLEQDEKMLQLLQESMEGHLEFMLPDGAWDNSWGTRQNKWSYWGSRTTDGCQPAFALMAERNPAFATAAYRNTELLKRCTVNGLLAGGLHYASHGVKPCVHHTFAHAKSLAFVLDNNTKFVQITKENPLPRSVANGVKHFPEIDVWTATKGPWKATVSSYDAIFKKPHSQAATGGSLALLWHDRVGPIFTASMAEYIIVEANNQQPQPDGEDFPLTPRIEDTKDGKWYSNLFDIEAKVNANDDERITFDIETQLTDRERTVLPKRKFNLQYVIEKDKTVISAKAMGDMEISDNLALVLPFISQNDEKVIEVSKHRIEIHKKDAILLIEANVPLAIMRTKRSRVFNMVPGFEALPIKASFSKDTKKIVCTVSITDK